MHSLRDQLSSEHEKLKETQQTTECRLRSGEAQKCELTERLEKCHAEIHTLRGGDTVVGIAKRIVKGA